MTSVAALRLAIDCSTEHLALALVDGSGSTLASRAREVGRLHAALLTLELTELFATAGVARGAVAEVRVGVGPGSYTGLRVAGAAAKGLGRAWGVPVTGVLSLLAQAGPEPGVGQHAVATRDARKGNVYVQPCTRRQGTEGRPAVVVSLGPPQKVQRGALGDLFPGWLVLDERVPDAALLAATTDTVATQPLYL